MATEYQNVSSDLLWEICNKQNSLLCKRKMAGGVQFSRDPMNLVNKHSRKYEGFVNEKAIGIQSAPAGEGKGLVMTTKRSSKINQPKSAIVVTNYGSQYTIRKTFRSIVNSTAKRGYRPDLRAEAVARASALHQTGRTKKDTPPKKPRGAKAKRLAAAGES